MCSGFFEEDVKFRKQWFCSQWMKEGGCCDRDWKGPWRHMGSEEGDLPPVPEETPRAVPVTVPSLCPALSPVDPPLPQLCREKPLTQT